MARGLARRRRSVRVITAHPHYPDWQVREGYGQWSHDEIIDRVPIRRMRHYVPRAPRGLARLLSEVSFGIRAAFTRWGRPDVAVVVSPALFSSALVVARARLLHPRTPVVAWVQDLYTLGLAETGQSSETTLRLMRAIEGRVLRAADRVIVIHDRFVTRVHEDLGVPRERVDVIRNWTHLGTAPSIDRPTARAEFGWKPSETIVLHAGNMGVKQGLENVIEAARLADDSQAPVRFVLLGTGSERTRLEAVGRNTRSLQFIDPLDNEGFSKALAAADVLLVNELPGVSEMAVPSKLTSYFAAGRPVLAATDPDGITADEVRTARAGVVVRSGEPAALLEAALSLGQDPTASLEFGTAGRAYRETVLNEEHAIDRFIAVVDGVVPPVHSAG